MSVSQPHWLRAPRGHSRRWRAASGLAPATLASAAPWLALALGGVAFWMWQAQRRVRSSQALPATSPLPPPPVPCARPALPPPAPSAGTELRELPRQEPPPRHPPRHQLPLPTPWLERASVAIHLRQPRELIYIARELDAAGYPAAAGLLHNYSILIARPSADRRRIQLEVARMLSAALAQPAALGARRRVAAQAPASSPDAPLASTAARARAAWIGPRPAARDQRASQRPSEPIIPLPFAASGRRRVAR